MTDGLWQIMKVKCFAECSKGSILQYFWPALSDNWSWKPIFDLFESAILVEAIMRNNSVKLFWIWTIGSGGNVIEIHFLSRALAAPLFSGVEPLVQFWQKVSWATILWNYFEFGPLVVFKIFLDWSFGGGEPFVQFSRGDYEEQFCEIIFNSDQWFRWRCLLNIFLIWSSGGLFVMLSGTICAILVEGIKRNNSVK